MFKSTLLSRKENVTRNMKIMEGKFHRLVKANIK